MKKLVLILFLFITTDLLAQSPNTPITPTDTTQRDPIKPPQSEDIDPVTDLNTGYYIADNLSMVKGFSKFYQLMDAAGLTETFRSRGPITIFLPGNEVVAKLSAGKTDSLLRKDNLPKLIALVSYHAVPGKLTFRKIASQIDKKTGIATFTTLSGGKLYAKYDGGRNLILVDETGRESIITRDGIKQHNGLVNVIDTVLQPKNRLL
jgi:uncharacterized surface protein with fasciclin (FAS1) repeats